MKVHTNEFKEEIKTIGKQLSSLVIYNQDGKTITLGESQLNSITPHFKTQLLKSVMKQLDIDSNVEIPVGTELNYKFGVRTRNEDTDDETANYDYIDFGNYIVYSVEKQEDTNSYSIVCYDKMLWSMVPYESFVDEYPITIRDYLDKLATKIGLEFANKTDTFTNYDKEIPAELYLTEEKKDNGYRYRDALDEISASVGGNIVINKDDKLEIRYITETNDTINESFFKSNKVKTGKKYGPINSIVLSRSAESDNIYLRDEDSVKANGLCEIKIKDNQIMNFNNRDEFLQGLLDRLNGTEFYLNDYSSTGVCYYDVCDRYSVKIGNNTYSCVMFDDEIDITQGLEEQITTEEPEITETDYSKADKTDRKINSTYLIVNKQGKQIEGVVNSVNMLDVTVTSNYQEVKRKFDNYTPIDRTVQLENSVSTIQTDTYTKTEIDTKLIDGSVTKVSTTSGTFDTNGLTIEQTGAKTKGNFNATGLRIVDNTSSVGENLLFAGYDDKKQETVVETANITVSHYLVVGNNSRLEDYNDGTGVFDI